MWSHTFTSYKSSMILVKKILNFNWRSILNLKRGTILNLKYWKRRIRRNKETDLKQSTLTDYGSQISKQKAKKQYFYYTCFLSSKDYSTVWKRWLTMTSSIKFPCKVCGKKVYNTNWATQCDYFDYWIHINFNNLDYIHYKFLQISNDSWYCILCCSQIFPFNSMKTIKTFLCLWVTLAIIINHLNYWTIKYSSYWINLKIDSENLKINNDPENVVQFKFYDIDVVQKMKIPNKSKSLTLFHISACSLKKILIT